MSAHRIKNVNFTEASTYPVNLWVPVNGACVDVRNLHLVVVNKNTGVVAVGVRLRQDGVMRLLGVAVVGSNASETLNMPIVIDLFTDFGDGTAAAIDVFKLPQTTSTSFVGFASIIGEEV
jgi:hypothetical protein